MVVVVESFAHGGECEPLKIGRFVRIRTASEVVTDCVHGCRTREVQVEMRKCCEESDGGTEHDDENCDAECESTLVVSEEDLVPLVIGQVLGVLVDDCGVIQRLAIQGDVADLNLFPAEQHR